MSNGQPFPPLTPMQAYEDAHYQYPWIELHEPIRIPIAGPAPYNTLAVLQTQVDLTKYWDYGEQGVYRETLLTPTALRINGYDPHTAPPVQQCSAGAIHMMQIKSGDDPFPEGNVHFIMAIDQILPETLVDAQGNVMLSVDVASYAPGAKAVAKAEVTTWVLFYESEPPTPPADPQLAADRLSADALAARAPALLDGYRNYIGSPGADLPRAATEVADISEQLAGYWTMLAAQAQAIAVDAWRAYTPPPDDESDYTLTFAEARHNLIFRLTENGQSEAAAVLAPETIAGYRAYLAHLPADPIRVSNDLRDLSKELSGYDQADALSAQQASVDALESITSPSDRPNWLILLAEALQDLTIRLIDVGRAADGAVLVPQSADRYREYLAGADPDRARVRRDLDQYQTSLTAAGLTDASATVATLQASLAP